MNKSFLSAMIISSLLLAPYLKADQAQPTEDQTEAVAPDSTMDQPAADQASTNQPAADEGTPEGTAVGQASTEGSKAAKKKMWQNIGLAVGAVAVAVTALILVADNDGHRKSHSH